MQDDACFFFYNFRNLLLPDGVPAERQRARFIFKVYKAEGATENEYGYYGKCEKSFHW